MADQHQPATETAPRTSGHTIHWAGLYDAVTWALTLGQEPAIRRATISAASLTPGERVLDVGCGTGRLTMAAWAAVQPAGEVSGIDASAEMVQTARTKAQRKKATIDFRLAAIEQLPFGDSEFDAVLSSLMLHHLPDDVKQQGFAEIHRVLKPGGRFLAVDLADKDRHFMARIPALFGHAMARGYVDSLKSMITSAGFSEVEEVATKFRYLAFLRSSKKDT